MARKRKLVVDGVWREPACPVCDTPIPPSVPSIGELTYTCECGEEIAGSALRSMRGFPEPS